MVSPPLQKTNTPTAIRHVPATPQRGNTDPQKGTTVMLDTLGLIPKSIAPAVIGYLLLCYGLSDVFADRLARWVHVPACQKGLASQAAKATYRLDSQQEAARELISELFRSMPGLRDLPGAQSVEKLTRSRRDASNPADFADRCTCLAAAARSETRFDQAIWVASLRFIEPSGVSDFKGVMARLDGQGQCTGGRS